MASRPSTLVRPTLTRPSWTTNNLAVDSPARTTRSPRATCTGRAVAATSSCCSAVSRANSGTAATQDSAWWGSWAWVMA